MVCAKSALRLSYLTAAQFEAHQIQFKSRVLGAVAFGAQRPCVSAPDCPYAWIDIPIVKGDAAFEVWTSAQTVVRDDTDEFVSARDDDILFGCVLTEPGDSLDAASRLVYCRIFDFIDARGYGHLLRVWNYFPQINAVTDGVEQYVKFNAGRHEAFAAKRRVLGSDTPAACALGSRSGPLVVYFLAAKRAGRLVENPRQTSAYDYPAQYGPRSPVFSRAVLMQAADKPLLFISGTASIVGHETLHVGNAPEQARETVANILAVIAQARRAGIDPDARNASMLLKIYVRHADYVPMIESELTRTFGDNAGMLYLQADICRSDLLLEVEAVVA